MKRMHFVLAALLLLGVASWAEAANRVVLDATPSTRIDSDPSSTRRRVLSRAEALKARVLIVETDGRYFWASRENRELLLVSSGATKYFIDPAGGGYVKVVDELEPGVGAVVTYKFYEHVSLWMGTTTCFGMTRSFDP